jgi:2-polyprenyl-3-methyl-5-hydroxy-6-metoxy-1,4-benzoquinol methylase
VNILRSLGPLDRGADIGCRNGREAAYYRDAGNIREMHGFDIAEAPLVKARERGIVAHRWISGETRCPADDGYFDAVTALDVIEHIFDTDVFLSELHRVVSKNGHLVIATPNLAWWWSRLRLLRGAAPAGIGGTSSTHALDRAIDVKHLRVNIPSEWLHLFEKHGFSCTSTVGYNFPSLLRFPFNKIDNLLVDIKYLANSYIYVLRKT